MKLVYTEQSLVSLEEALNFIAPKVSHEKLIEIRNEILDAADTLLLHPLQGRTEPYLEHLNIGHRRLSSIIIKSSTGLSGKQFTLPIFLIPGKTQTK